MPAQRIVEDLDSFADAVRSGDLDRARRVADRLSDQYDALRVEENAAVERALAGRDRLDIPRDDKQRLNRLAFSQSATQMARSGFLTATATHLSDPAATDADELVANAGKLREQESELLDAADAASPVLDDVTLPPVLGFASVDAPEGPHPKGGTFTATTTLQNVGDDVATSVSVSHDAVDGVTVTPGSRSVGDLAPQSNVTSEFEVTGDEAGEYTLSFTASADVDSTSKRLVFEVVSKGDLVESILDGLSSLSDRLEALPKGVSRSLSSKVETAVSCAEKAGSFVEGGRAKQANNALNAASKALGAFLNEVDALSRGKGNGRKIDSATTRALRGLASRLVDLIALAKRAEI